MLYSVVQCCSVLLSAVQCCAMLCSAVQCYAMLCSSVQVVQFCGGVSSQDVLHMHMHMHMPTPTQIYMALNQVNFYVNFFYICLKGATANFNL